MNTLLSILNQTQNVSVIDAAICKSDYVSLDLSKTNTDLLTFDCDDAVAFKKYIESHLKKNDAKVAFGGYNEIRNLYKRSTIFNSQDQKERSIHIGLDLWIKAETPVLAAFEGKIHSFCNNKGLGNYGPTIILEHQIDNIVFYTLYGHLSEKSIANLTVGASVEKGATLARLGGADVNGNYAPHLHFQIIADIQQNFGDYPGVCSTDDLNFYLTNCPDPNLLLKL